MSERPNILQAQQLGRLEQHLIWLEYHSLELAGMANHITPGGVAASRIGIIEKRIKRALCEDDE